MCSISLKTQGSQLSPDCLSYTSSWDRDTAFSWLINQSKTTQWVKKLHRVIFSITLWNLFLSGIFIIRVPMHPWKYWNFFLLNSRPWKYLKKRTGAWKSLNFIPQVLESPWIYQIKLCDISNFVKLRKLEICQVFFLTQDLLIIVMFCFC